MLTKVEVEFGETTAPTAMVLPILGITPRDSLLIRSIKGLTPTDVDLFIGDYAQDGGTYQGRRVGKRNVVITIELNPNPALGETIPGLRELLNKTFMDPLVDADYVKMNFFNEDDLVRYVVGYTEKFESEIFETTDNMAQISLICPDPYIRNDETKILSNLMGWTSLPVPYLGTAETGFQTEIYVAAASEQMVLDLNGRMMFLTGPFIKSQMIYINTTRGSYDIQMTTQAELAAWYALPGNEDKLPSDAWASLQESGQTTALIANLSTDSRWLELHSQANTLKVYGEISTPTDGRFAIRKLVYVEAWWGI